MLNLTMRLCVAAACVGLCAAGQDGRVAIEYGNYEQGQCRNATTSGSRGRTEIGQIAPGVSPAQECRYCRSVRRCSLRDAAGNLRQCVTGRDCQWSTTPPSNRSRSIG